MRGSLLPKRFRNRQSSEESESETTFTEEFTIKNILKQKKWVLLETKSIKREIRLADIGKHCTQVPPETYERILNKMFRAPNGTIADFEGDDFVIEFNFDFLGQRNENQYTTPECYYLWLLSQSKPHETLLGHPMIASFLNIKWKKVRWFYFVDVFLQGIGWKL